MLKQKITSALEKFQSNGDISLLGIELRELFVKSVPTAFLKHRAVFEIVELVPHAMYLVEAIDSLVADLKTIKAEGNDPREYYMVSLTSSGSILYGLTA